MLRISLQTLRARRATLAGAFIAIWLAVTLASATGLLMAGALGPPRAGRPAAPDAAARPERGPRGGGHAFPRRRLGRRRAPRRRRPRGPAHRPRLGQRRPHAVPPD